MLFSIFVKTLLNWRSTNLYVIFLYYSLCGKEPVRTHWIGLDISFGNEYTDNCIQPWWRWLSGRTSVFGRRSFPVLCPTCS